MGRQNITHENEDTKTNIERISYKFILSILLEFSTISALAYKSNIFLVEHLYKSKFELCRHSQQCLPTVSLSLMPESRSLQSLCSIDFVSILF